MKTVLRRIARLEEQFSPPDWKPRVILRVILERCDQPYPRLEGATVQRTLCADGTLLEVVHPGSGRQHEGNPQTPPET
jgi:hypothetical protein